MIAVLIVPTGLGAEIGGHAGDANPVAKLVANACDILITHPNVVNASDINEMTENTLYTEGSILDRFLEGEIKLKPVRTHNKILLAVNRPLRNDTINAVSAARATIGAHIEIVQLDTPLRMIAKMDDNGRATGDVQGWQELVEQIKKYDFDALAIASKIETDIKVAEEYMNKGTGVNPWGGIEAKASKLIATALDKPVAHAPFIGELDEGIFEDFDQEVDTRLSAETVSICYIHCVFKGLHKSPRISKTEGLSNKDVDCLITPIGCVGRPHIACMKAGIPIIAVKENKTILNDPMPSEFIIVNNYLEAVGVMKAMEAGVTLESVRRPIKQTKIVNQSGNIRGEVYPKKKNETIQKTEGEIT